MNIFSKFLNTGGRAGYAVGWLASEKSLEDLRVYLHKEWGFGGNFSAHVDRGEVLHWKKPSHETSEYHLMIYDDGEIRGYLDSGNKKLEVREKILEFLGDFAVKRKNVSNLVSDPNAFSPNPEIVKEKD